MSIKLALQVPTATLSLCDRSRGPEVIICGDSEADSNPSSNSGEAAPLPVLDTSDDDRFVVGDVSEDEVMHTAKRLMCVGPMGVQYPGY